MTTTPTCYRKKITGPSTSYLSLPNLNAFHIKLLRSCQKLHTFGGSFSIAEMPHRKIESVDFTSVRKPISHPLNPFLVLRILQNSSRPNFGGLKTDPLGYTVIKGSLRDPDPLSLDRVSAGTPFNKVVQLHRLDYPLMLVVILL